MKLLNRLLLLTLLGFIILFALPSSAQVERINRANCGFFGRSCGGAETFGGTIKNYLIDVKDVFIILIGTIATAFLVYAAFKYVTSQGDESAAATAKRQISYALIGIFVATGAGAILNLVGADADLASGAPSATNLINRINPVVNAFAFLLLTVASAFLLYAAYKYVMSQGDESAAATAKRQIAYALIGLFVSGTRLIITQLVITPTAAAVTLHNNLQLVIGAFTFLIGTVATIFLVYAGFKYITSQGDEAAAATAKRQIAYALIGLFVAFTTGPIIALVQGPSGSDLKTRLLEIINVGLFLVGTVAAIYLLYAGFKYISSTGDENEAAQAKNQIIYAILGIIVAGLALIISTTMVAIVDPALANDTSALIAVIRAVVNAFLTLVGTAAAIYMLVAGTMYITSQGDEEQAKRAKLQVIYGAVGIVVIVLSGVIVNFVINAVNS